MNQLEAGPKPTLSSRRRFVRGLLVIGLAGLVGCQRPYQVGDYVLVTWGEKTKEQAYPAFIVAKKSNNIYRVHFEGYPTRWDEDVSLPRILGRVTGPVSQPPPPRKVQIAQGLGESKSGDDSQVGRYKEGDHIRVSW